MTIPNLIAQLRAAAEDRADPFAWFEVASRSNITRILDAYAEMERALHAFPEPQYYEDPEDWARRVDEWRAAHVTARRPARAAAEAEDKP